MGVTDNLLSNWIHNYYEKTNKTNKQIVDGSASPFFQSFKKQYYRGKTVSWPVLSGGDTTTSRNPVVALARSRKEAKDNKDKFTSDLFRNFGFVVIDRQAQMATHVANSGSYFKDIEKEIDLKTGRMNEDILRTMYGTPGRYGEIGKVTAVDSTKLTIDKAYSIQNFEKDQKIELAPVTNAGVGAKKIAHGTETVFTVEKIDIETNEIFLVVDATLSNIAVGDLIFKEGDYDYAGKANPVGFINYIDHVSSASDPFLGLDTSKDLRRLKGYLGTLDGDFNLLDKGEAIYNTIMTCQKVTASRFKRYATTKVFAHPVHWESLVKSKIYKTSINVMNFKEKEFYGNESYQGLLLAGPKGSIAMSFDPSCPEKWVIGGYAPAYEIAYQAGKKGMLINFAMQGNSRVIVPRDGSNDNQLHLESYTNVINGLPGSSWMFEV